MGGTATTMSAKVQKAILAALSGTLHKSTPAAVKHTQNPAALPFTAPGKGGNSMPTGHVTNDAVSHKSGKGGGEGSQPVQVIRRCRTGANQDLHYPQGQTVRLGG